MTTCVQLTCNLQEHVKIAEKQQQSFAGESVPEQGVRQHQTQPTQHELFTVEAFFNCLSVSKHYHEKDAHRKYGNDALSQLLDSWQGRFGR